MNAEALTQPSLTFRGSSSGLRCREYQLRETCCDETQLHETIDAFPGSDLIGIEAKVLLGIPEDGFNLPAALIVFEDPGYLKRHIRCKDTEIPIRF